MNLHIDDFAAGVNEMLALYKEGNNIFDMHGGSLFPHNTTQSTWHYAKGDKHINITDGMHTFSFKGDLADHDTELEKMPDVPLPDLYHNATSRGKLQVHRSDPGSIYFTLQEGKSNPTYTLKHTSEAKWKAIPKPKKIKDILAQPVAPVNVNIESVKEGMLAELTDFTKESEESMIGNAINGGVNLVGRAALAPARIGAPTSGNILPRLNAPVTSFGDANQNATESLGSSFGNALTAGGIGAGLGGMYHLAKRNLLNTPEENAQEDAEGSPLLKRMAVPGLLGAGANLAGRAMFPKAINNPELKPFNT